MEAKKSAITILEENVASAKRELDAFLAKRIADKKAKASMPKKVLTVEEKKKELRERETIADTELKLRSNLLKAETKLEKAFLANQSRELATKESAENRKLRNHAMYVLAGYYLATVTDTRLLSELLGKASEKDKAGIRLLIAEVEKKRKAVKVEGDESKKS